MNTTSKLLSLPIEVYDMIQKELFAGSTVITKEDVMMNQDCLDARTFTYRADILRPIMQTCRVLRSTYVSAFYEHIEVCMVRSGRAWYLQLSERLEKVSEVMVAPEMKDLAAKVRVMTVCLTRRNDKVVLPKFAACLSSLPNLHTLQVMHAHSQMMTVIKNAFEGKVYPQIQNIILPTCAHNILRSCPEVKDVVCNEDDGSQLLTAIQKECKHVEKVEGIMMQQISTAKRFVKALPQVREIVFNNIYAYMLDHLTPLKHLCVIRIIMNLYHCQADQASHPEVDQSQQSAESKGSFVERALAVLSNSGASQSEKYLELVWQAWGKTDPGSMVSSRTIFVTIRRKRYYVAIPDADEANAEKAASCSQPQSGRRTRSRANAAS